VRAAGQSMLSALLLPVLLLSCSIFTLRPQNKRAKEQREMLSKVAGGG